MLERRKLGTRSLGILTLLAVCAFQCEPSVASSGNSAARSAALARLKALLEASPNRAPLRGRDGWLFLRDEATLLLSPRFWGVEAQLVSRVRDPDARDPLPPILDFHEQLAARGVHLLFVPIPAKLRIYPEKLLGDELGATVEGLDESVADFLRALRAKGLDDYDLTRTFLASKRSAPETLYLASDTHWSPRGIEAAARAIATVVRERAAELGIALPKVSPTPLKQETTHWRGDIANLLDDLRNTTEPVTLLKVVEPSPVSQKSAADSPILLLGDSNLIVFQQHSSGFRQHLERELGIPIDQIAGEAGGPTASRQALARQPERLKGKKLIIWLTAARLFVGAMGWSRVDLGPPNAKGEGSSSGPNVLRPSRHP